MPPPSNFNLQQEITIIEFYRENPCLWDKQDMLYKDSLEKKRLRVCLARMLNKAEDEVIKRWKTLLDTYRAEVKKEKLGKTTCGGQERYRSSWRHLARMRFTRAGEEVCDSTINLSQAMVMGAVVNETDDELTRITSSPLTSASGETMSGATDFPETITAEINPTTTSPAATGAAVPAATPHASLLPRDKRRRLEDEVFKEAIKYMQSNVTPKKEPDDDEPGLFCKYMAQILRKLPERRRINAEMELRDVLAKHQLNTTPAPVPPYQHVPPPYWPLPPQAASPFSQSAMPAPNYHPYPFTYHPYPPSYPQYPPNFPPYPSNPPRAAPTPSAKPTPLQIPPLKQAAHRSRRRST